MQFLSPCSRAGVIWLFVMRLKTMKTSMTRSFPLLVLAAGWFLPSPTLRAQNAFTRGPFVQNATAHSVQIIWRTASPATTRVGYGLAPASDNLIADALPVTNHVVTLTGLAPGTTYSYTVASENETGMLSSPPETFRTLKTEGPVSFAFISDTTGGRPLTTNLVAGIISDHPDLVVHGGDITGYGNNELKFDTEFFRPFQPLIKNTPVYLISGNHDADPDFSGDPTGALFQNAYYLPTNSATGTELFYSFDHGDAHFVCLYNPWFHCYVFTNGSVQYQWLTNDLAASTKPWKLMFSHFPAATASYHSFDNYNGGPPDQYEVMDLLLPVARQYGVQMIFSGHDHAFQRFAPTNGVHCVVNGSGGQSLYYFTTMHSALSQFWLAYDYLRVSITNDTLLLQAIDTNGLVFDRMVVQKAAPTRQIYQAVWHRPQLGLGPPNDSDGNRVNQWFDFIEHAPQHSPEPPPPTPPLEHSMPLLPRAGQFSNLGRVYVNNDSTNIYIGLREVMIYGNNNLFLFLESPRLAGVSTMAGIGNGVLDPAGQGADGLDCLENLSFTNFTPAIACLLGDEYADGQYRQFARSNLVLNIGQGAWRLDQNLSDVPGVVLQQFNRSPQLTPINSPINLEQNADFITLAIPFSALGGVEPGDTIKLGAVVGGPGFDPVAQTRQLDTAVLGCALHGSGQSSVVLEGISLQLADDPTPPRVTITRVAPNQLELGWEARAGKSYDIEYSADLTRFVRLDTVTAAAPRARYTLEAAGGNSGFFRVKQIR